MNERLDVQTLHSTSDALPPRFEAATDPLRTFVPRLAVDWLRDEPAARARCFEGTLVFADISGFTDLTEALAKRGREGAEEIAGVIDAAFAELIRRAYAQQADLLKFGGDAVLLLFRGESHALRAGAAAVGMQEALTGMRRRSTSAGPVRLRMSIGIHTGAFHCFLVGGTHRELIVAGADATACVETEAAARAGEIALSETTAQLFEPHLLGESRDGIVLLAHNPDVPETVPAFFDPSGVDLSQLLPAAYTRELRGEPADPEHRHVAVAFVEIRSTDELLEREGPAALAAALEERITTIQQSCLAFGVTFAQTDVSARAVKAILLAGAPRTAGGEEEELMLRAARAIIEQPGALPVRIGVNTGRVFAGVVGTLTRRTYSFYGDAINTAARIMVRAADGQLLAREDVLERARTTYITTPIEPFTAKGKAEPVRASDVGVASGEREQEAIGPFVGREAELDTLLAALAGARAGAGSLAIVTGAPGLGKTRLLGELGGQAAGALSLRVGCAQTGATQAYSAVGAIARRALQLDSHAPAAEVERRLRTAVARGAPELEPWLPLLGLVVGLTLPPTPESAALEESFVAERVATSVEALLAGVLPEAALIVIDDAHFLDETSAALIGHIARGIHARPWLLVIAHRADASFAAPEGSEPLRVPLAPLDDAAALRLVLELTDDAPLPAHIAAAIAGRSDGSPLFVTEMVAAMRAGADHDTLPDSVEDLMSLQIDELAGADRAVLRQASVMGTRFTRTRLVAALDLGEDDAEAIIGRLEGLLVADGEDGLRFRHGLLRDAAYEGLSYRRRRVLHRRVGESLEQDSGADVSAVAGDLTRHFFEAGMWEKSLHYGLVAGAAARTVYANVDAAAVLDRAVAAGASWRRARPEAVMRAAEALGDVRLSLGELDRAQTAFALARRRVRGDAVERARLLRKEADVAYRLGDYARAERVLTAALSALESVSSTPATAPRARIGALLGIVTLWRGRPREAVEWLQSAIADAESVDANEALAHALAGLDLAYNTTGDARRGNHSDRALVLYEELGDLVSMGGVLNNLGTSAYFAGRWNEALDLYRRALAAWDQAGDTRSVSMASFNIGEILSAQGRLDEAEPLLREAERSSRAAGGASDIAESMMETALLDARRGNVERALAQLEEARRLLEGSGNAWATLLAEARMAEALELGGDYDRAAELAARTLERSSGEEGSALLRPVLNRVLGQALLLAGKLDAAREALELAISEANEVEHRYEEALALATLSRIEAASSEAAARREALFEQLGIVALPARWET
jgi:class 3 adenylate cyclase/tetratricopeptide (TPR) repeat protein